VHFPRSASVFICVRYVWQVVLMDVGMYGLAVEDAGDAEADDEAAWAAAAVARRTVKVVNMIVSRKEWTTFYCRGKTTRGVSTTFLDGYLSVTGSGDPEE
jgi:hypothetical protein